MKHRSRSIRNILKSLLNFNKNKHWLNEWEIFTEFCPKKIEFVKKYHVTIEITIIKENGKEYRFYRLKETSENIKRAKALLKALS